MPDGDARRPVAGTRFGDVRRHAEVDSTNRLAVDLARAGEPEGVVVVADHQTAGRGRRGRTWLAAPGSSLLLSVLTRPPLPPSQRWLVPATVAMAASDACAEVAGFRPGLKWPNDLVAVGPDGQEGKLGGLLVEADANGDRLRFLVVGLGLNVAGPRPPAAELALPAVTATEAAGRAVEREALLVAVLRALGRRYDALLGADGGEAVLAEYRRRCATIGRRVRAERAARDGGDVVGRAVDVTAAGHLVVEPDGGGPAVEVAVGDVVHLRPA